MYYDIILKQKGDSIMSNRLLQGIVHQMRDTIDRIIGVIDESAIVIACSELSKIGKKKDFITVENSDIYHTFTKDGYTYKFFGPHLRPEYAVFVEGIDGIAKNYVQLLAVSLSNIKHYYDEKYDKNNFVKNVVLDNILPGDVYVKSRELQFKSDVNRVALIIRVSKSKDLSAYDIILNLFPDRASDFIFTINDTDIVLIKEIKDNVSKEDIETLSLSIVDTLGSEFYIKSAIGIGTIVSGIKDFARSFREAQIALEVGKVFDTEKSIITYENLGIARLIYQLPSTLCDTFLKEVFKNGSIDNLDQETLFTIQSFFENNLNVSETSRKLFVHRNTLVYRLEKIKKITGLDLREFDHAIIFKIALMVKKYLISNPIKF